MDPVAVRDHAGQSGPYSMIAVPLHSRADPGSRRVVVRDVNPAGTDVLRAHYSLAALLPLQENDGVLEPDRRSNAGAVFGPTTCAERP